VFLAGFFVFLTLLNCPRSDRGSCKSPTLARRFCLGCVRCLRHSPVSPGASVPDSDTPFKEFSGRACGSSGGSVRRSFQASTAVSQRDWCPDRECWKNLRKPEPNAVETLQRCHSTRIIRRQRSSCKAVRPWCRRSLGGFRFTEHDFHQIIDTAGHALEKTSIQGSAHAFGSGESENILRRRRRTATARPPARMRPCCRYRHCPLPNPEKPVVPRSLKSPLSLPLPSEFFKRS